MFQPHSQVGNDSTVDMGRIMQVLPGGTVEILSAEARLAAAMKGPTEEYMRLGQLVEEPLGGSFHLSSNRLDSGCNNPCRPGSSRHRASYLGNNAEACVVHSWLKLRGWLSLRFFVFDLNITFLAIWGLVGIFPRKLQSWNCQTHPHSSVYSQPRWAYGGYVI